MISNVSDLVSQLIERERKVLSNHAITHAPTIGRMYEGLTKKAVELTIPPEAHLIVAGGFIRGTDGKISHEQDVVVAFGDHEAIPHTDSFIFDIRKIIAVIEVKKTLGRSSLSESIANLNTILGVEPNFVFNAEAMCFRFQDTTRRLMTDIEDCHQLTGVHCAIFRELFRRRTLPLRIVLGYEGYSTEYGLRRGVSSLVQAAIKERNLGPIQLPDAILSVGASIVTSASGPWTAPIDDNSIWPYLLSNGYLPAAIVLLELLWGRLSDYGIVKLAAFGEDLEIEPWNRFMDLEYSTLRGGWMLNETVMRRSSNAPTSPPAFEEWRPAVVSDDAAVLIMRLARRLSMSLQDFGQDTVYAEPAMRELEKVGLIGRHILDTNRFGLLTRKLLVIMGVDGNNYAGENVSGRLVRWMVRQKLIPSREGESVTSVILRKNSDGIEGVEQSLPLNGIGWTELIARITSPSDQT